MALAFPAFATTTLSPEVLEAVRIGEAGVIIGFDVPELPGNATEAQMQAHMQRVKVIQDQILRRAGISPDDPKAAVKYGIKRFQLTGGLALRADQSLLNMLAQDPAVSSIVVDGHGAPASF